MKHHAEKLPYPAKQADMKLQFEDISEKQIRRTFDTNILGYIWMAQAAIPHLQPGGYIINMGALWG